MDCVVVVVVVVALVVVGCGGGGVYTMGILGTQDTQVAHLHRSISKFKYSSLLFY